MLPSIIEALENNMPSITWASAPWWAWPNRCANGLRHNNQTSLKFNVNWKSVIWASHVTIISADWGRQPCGMHYHHHQGRSQEFAKGDKRGGLGDGNPPAVSRGIPGGGLGPETHAEYSTEQSHRSSQIAYSTESDKFSLKKFPATRGGGGHVPVSPLGYTTDHHHHHH